MLVKQPDKNKNNMTTKLDGKNNDDIPSSSGSTDPQRKSMSVRAKPHPKRRLGNHNRVTLALTAIRKFFKSISITFPKHTHVFNEPDWLKIIKLLAKLGILSLKVRYLMFQQRNLLREQKKLLLIQRNHLLTKSRGS